MEDYPELKASENMMQLAEELTSTENRIASARQGYNDLVQKFNEYQCTVLVQLNFSFLRKKLDPLIIFFPAH
jgi:hypothetical protein